MVRSIHSLISLLILIGLLGYTKCSTVLPNSLEYDVNVAPKGPNFFQKLRISFEKIRSQWRIKAMETFQRFYRTTTKAPELYKPQRLNNRKPMLKVNSNNNDEIDVKTITELEYYGALSNKFKKTK